MIVIKLIQYIFVEGLLWCNYGDTMVSRANMVSVAESLLSNGKDRYESNHDKDVR